MKVKYIIILVIITILITGCGQQREEYILDGYNDCDEYFDDGFRKYTDYCKYYYDEEADQIFAENEYYTKVSKDYIILVKDYFDNFPSEFMSEPEKYDFDSSCVTEDDYFYKNSQNGDYDVCLYDVESHTLYYIHDN